MKNSNDTIGNRTRDLPICSAVPQPTAPPRAPTHRHMVMKLRMSGAISLIHPYVFMACTRASLTFHRNFEGAFHEVNIIID